MVVFYVGGSPSVNTQMKVKIGVPVLCYCGGVMYEE